MRTVVVVLLSLTALAGCLQSDAGDDPANYRSQEEAAAAAAQRAAQQAPASEPEPSADPGPVVTDPAPPTTNTTPEPAPEQPPVTASRWPFYPNDGSFERVDVKIESFDGHMIPASVFKPIIASTEVQFPLLVHSHGFTGSRWTGSQPAPYVEAGFGVLSFDERGHGEARATSEVTFMHPTAEVQDVLAVLDYAATLDWVLMEAPGDPLLGTIGGSYGGAFQLMGHIFDDANRIDAMVPDITWHNITTALAPNGAIKSGWVDLFYAAGNTVKPITFSDDFHAGFAWATATNELPEGQVPGVPDLVRLFTEASPQNYPGKLDIPTLYTQGMGDTLFPLNHAVWNHQATKATGAPTGIYTHNGGHILTSHSLYGNTDPVPAVGLQGAEGGTPCGTVRDLSIAWHQKWLLGLEAGLETNYCIALDDERAVVGNSWPLESTATVLFDAPGPYPIAQAVAGNFVPLATIDGPAEGEMVAAGIPRLSGSIVSPGADAIVYFGFYKLDEDGLWEHIVNDQMRPLRIKGPNAGAVNFDMELSGIGTTLAAGDSMVLVATSIEPIFFGNTGRLPAGLVLQGLTLELPVVVEPNWK